MPEEINGNWIDAHEDQESANLLYKWLFHPGDYVWLPVLRNVWILMDLRASRVDDNVGF